jgi:hypothetical protein
MWGAPVVASTATRTSCPLFCWFLSWCGIFIIFDWDFLVGWGLLLRCNRVLLYIIVVLLVIFGCWFLEWRSYCKMSAILRRNLELISRCRTCLLCCIWFDFGVVVLNFHFDISWVICYLSCWYCFDKQWHLAGNFRGVKGRLCDI